jgi:glycosyltransferase involved in cell wall biosynthesis
VRVGIDATSWANPRGYGRFTREVLRALVPLAPQHELVCLLDERARRDFDVTAANVTPIVVPLGESPTLAAAADGARSPVDLLRMTAATWRARVDVFFAPTVYTYFPLPPGLRAVVTIHDAVAERFPELTLPSTRARWFWRAKVAAACWQARLVLTVSDYAARDIGDALRLPASRIRVATEAPAAHYRPSDSRGAIDAVAARLGLPPSSAWFLYVGGLGPHKRVDAIVAAHARIVRERPDAAPWLVLTGPAERDVFLAEGRAIHDAIDAHGTAAHVRWTGFLSDEDLRHVYSGALALLLVSAREGFGLPAVEAAACGTPVIATTASPLPQLLAGGGLFVEPADVDAIAAAMRRLLDDEPGRRAMGAVARQQASALSWERCARQTLAAIEEAAA